MKKTLLLTFASALVYLSLVSYSDGPNDGGAGNRTGGPGSTGTCAQAGCHSAASANTMVTVTLKDEVTGEEIMDGKYIPLRTYNVDLMVHNNSLSHIGFQAEVVDAAGNSIGVLSAGPGQHTGTAAGKKIVEHSAPISGMLTTFKWTSPAAGAGKVTFHVMGNAVNNDGNSTGDAPSNPFSESFDENNTSVASVNKSISLKAGPNPVVDQLTLKLDNATKGEYIINAFGVNGAKLYETKVQINSTQYETTLQTDKWAAGIYYVQIIKDGMKHVITVVKQ
ncbi:MAG: T9SS type A sorting domain-containing protein [Sphingobacteriales bacterium]|nr:MAG: T9SS type A sorting domain-containing protein [Sphingobacteriales bacterium]